MADGLADLTMDLRQTWEKRYDTTLKIHESNLLIQTDGGLREENCAAAASVVGLWGGDGEDFRHEPFLAHGALLEASTTVFAAEAIALDEATSRVQQIMSS